MQNFVKIFIAGLFLNLICQGSLSQVPVGWKASEKVSARLTASRPKFNYYEEEVPLYTLPDLMKMNDGRLVGSELGWAERRSELLSFFSAEVYGKVPSTSYNTNYKILTSDKSAMGGKATLKQVQILISSEGKSITINLTLFVPNSVKGKVPAFLLICNRGMENIDPLRKVKSEFWPAEEAIARGYAIAAFYNGDVDPDEYDGFKNGIHGVLDRGERNDESWGTIAAWAWGAQRCLDYLLTEKRIAGDKIALVGHSRGGKTALWAGATDIRFGMIVANESGCGGAALARRRFGETVERINTAFPHWFCLNYRKYNNNEHNMPADMQMLLALIAPRPLYVDCADEDLWGDPRGSYLALYHALPAWKLFGKAESLPPDIPPLNKQIISGNLAFHIRDGEHNLKLSDWNYFMDLADKVWKK
jgi:hypothetical protein